MKKNNCPFIVTHAKFHKMLKLNNLEIHDLIQMKEDKDEKGIIDLFVDGDKYELHSADPELIRYDDYVLIFGHHACLNKHLILIEYDGTVYEFIDKWNCRLFVGGVTNIIYSVRRNLLGHERHPKPVAIYKRLEYPS